MYICAAMATAPAAATAWHVKECSPANLFEIQTKRLIVENGERNRKNKARLRIRQTRPPPSLGRRQAGGDTTVTATAATNAMPHGYVAAALDARGWDRK